MRFAVAASKLDLHGTTLVMPTGTKVDPFRPQQPQIPGVPAKKQEGPAAPLPRANNTLAAGRSAAPALWPPSFWPVWLRLGLVALVVLAVVWIGWRVRSSSRRLAEPPATAPASAERPLHYVPPKALPLGPGEIGNASELAKPWSSKRFRFRNKTTGEVVPALAVRLPDGSLWGISLREPYGNCELDYVTDLSALLSQYSFQAVHAMVVNPCSGSVYDLAQYTGGPNGLVRGRVVRGTAVRAPLAIEVVQRGKRIVAVRME